MKAILTICLTVLLVKGLTAQSVGVNNNGELPHPSAILDVTSSDKGFLTPRMTKSERNGIANPATGLMIYQTDDIAGHYYFDGEKWSSLGNRYGNINDDLQIGILDTTATLNEYLMGSTAQIFDTTGILYDSGGPEGNYSNNEDTSVVLYGPFNSIGVMITITSLSTESPYDSVRLSHLLLSDESYSFSGQHQNVAIPMICGVQNAVKISFSSNGANTDAGFVIRWDWIRLPATQSEPVPLAGWYFNSPKIAMRGGTNNFNNWSQDSLGYGSLGWGVYTKAKGNYSTAFGYKSAALGIGAFAAGASIAAGAYSVSMGESCATDGNYAIAIGLDNFAHTSAIAIGRYDTANVFGATAIGGGNRAYGQNSAAIGYFTKTEGPESFAAGSYTVSAGFGSTALGYGTKARGRYSTATGYATKANGYASFVVGTYNDTIVAPELNDSPATPLFIVGNGESYLSTSNAMIVRKDGRVGIGNNSPVTLLHVGTSTGHAIRIGSLETIADAGGSLLSVNCSLIPLTDDSHDLGSATNRWDDIWATNGVIQTSDERDKENIIEIEEGLDKVMQLRPVTYQWKESPDRSIQLGLIAQEVQDILPGVVRSTNIVRDEEGNISEEPTERLGMNYAALTPVIIKALQEVQSEHLQYKSDTQTRIEELSSSVEALRKENALLRDELRIAIGLIKETTK